MISLGSFAFLAQKAFFIFAGLVGLNFVIGFHELGHFLFCKLFKIRTPTFSIGFGPFLASKKIGQTTFALSSIPVGGYVEVAGLAEMGQGEQKDAHARDSQSITVKPYYQKLLVLMGGILFNLAFAYFAMILLFMIGLPKTEFLYPRSAIPVIGQIQSDSPAQKAQLEVGDRILAINGQELNNDAKKAFTLINSMPGQEVTLTIDRNGQQHESTIVLESKADRNGTQVGTLGISFEITGTQGVGFIEAVKQGVQITNAYIIGTALVLKNIFAKRDMSNLGGPLMVISQTIQAAGHSFGVFLFFLAVLSINLAVFNLIPLPILDGGQILFYTIEAIIGRPLSTKVKEYIHIASWILILGLMLYLSAFDIYKIAKPYLGKITG